MSGRALSLMSSATLALLLVGCPSDPDAGKAPAGKPAPAPPAAANAPAATPPPAQGQPGEAPPKGAGGPPPAEGGGPGEDGGASPPRAQPEINPGGQSVVITLTQTEPEKPDDGTQLQETIVKKGAYVTFSGVVMCSDCEGDLLLRLRPHFTPDGRPTDGMPAYVTSKVLDAAGEFSMVAEKGDHALVLELLVDANKDGVGTKGERLAVLERAGGLKPNQDVSGLELDASTDATRPEVSEKLDPNNGPDLKAADEKRRDEGRARGEEPK